MCMPWLLTAQLHCQSGNGLANGHMRSDSLETVKATFKSGLPVVLHGGAAKELCMHVHTDPLVTCCTCCSAHCEDDGPQDVQPDGEGLPKINVHACMHIRMQVPVGNEHDLVALMARGLGNRTVAATAMNAASSRSHCLVELLVQRHARNGGCARGKLCLVDLAGGFGWICPCGNDAAGVCCLLRVGCDRGEVCESLHGTFLCAEELR